MRLLVLMMPIAALAGLAAGAPMPNKAGLSEDQRSCLLCRGEASDQSASFVNLSAFLQ
ncbi:MAG: hypothetical protein AAGA05_05775 [Pseudomonadota bacterium]